MGAPRGRGKPRRQPIALLCAKRLSRTSQVTPMLLSALPFEQTPRRNVSWMMYTGLP